MRLARAGAVLAPARELAASFACWWLRELVGLVPTAWRMRNKRIEAHVSDDVVVIKIVRPPANAIEGRFELSDRSIRPADFASRLKQEHSLPIWIVPPAGAVLSRTVQVPKSIAARFENLLAIEADRWTPFAVSEIVAAWRVLQEDGEHKVDIELRFVPRALVDRWTESLRSFGLTASSIVLDANGTLRAAVGNVSTAQSRTRALAVGLVIAISLCVAVDWMAAVRERNVWQARVDAERRLLVRQAELESQIDALARPSYTATGRHQRAIFLAALSTALPETDWLTDVIVREGAVTLRGYAASVDALLRSFEPLAADSVVTIQGELAFDNRLQRQQFTVAFRSREGTP